MFRGDGHVVNDDISIHQPTVGEIIAYGEAEYFAMVHTLCSIPSDMKYPLATLGIDYMEISDFKFFDIMSKVYETEDTSILFGDKVDLSNMVLYVHPDHDEAFLLDEETGLQIDSLLYQEIVGFLREMHFIYPKVEKAANKSTKMFLIEEDKAKRERQKKEKGGGSILVPQMSTLMCCGWNKETLESLGIYAFMEAVARTQAINLSKAILSGVYCMADLSKDKEISKQIDMFRDLSDDRKKRSKNIKVDGK